MTNNARKAAVVLLSLPREQAAGILSQLAPREAAILCSEIADGCSASALERRAVIHEFAQADAGDDACRGDAQLARDLIERAFGQNHKVALAVRQSIESLPFEFLRHVDPETLLAQLADEHPQTIALVISRMPADTAAALLASLPDELQRTVARRVAAMEPASPEIVREVAAVLRTRLHSDAGHFEHVGGVAKLAEILNATPRQSQRNVLDNLSDDDPELVEQVRRYMFTFEDILAFADRDIQTLLKNVDTPQLAIALKRATPALVAKVFANMSPRAADLLREEMEYLGPVRVASVAQVQRHVIDLVRRLEESGAIGGESTEAAEEVAL